MTKFRFCFPRQHFLQLSCPIPVLPVIFRNPIFHEYSWTKSTKIPTNYCPMCSKCEQSSMKGRGWKESRLLFPDLLFEFFSRIQAALLLHFVVAWGVVIGPKGEKSRDTFQGWFVTGKIDLKVAPKICHESYEFHIKLWTVENFETFCSRNVLLLFIELLATISWLFFSQISLRTFSQALFPTISGKVVKEEWMHDFRKKKPRHLPQIWINWSSLRSRQGK